MKASHLEQIYTAFSTEPLRIDQMEEYYVSAVAGRGDNPLFYIRQILESTPDDYQHILFAGYRGCGKSTELNRLQQQIQDERLVINFSVMEELDPVSLHYIELFIVTMERLFGVAQGMELDISADYIQRISNWYQTKEIQEIKQQYIDGSTEFGVGAELNVPFFASFFAKLRASAKASKSLKEQLTQKVEPKLSQLILHCNELIWEVQEEIRRKKGMKEIVLIIEDLDKLPVDRAESLFYNYSQQLVQLKVDTIFTYPIALLYNPKFTAINNVFDDTYELPMIKINERDGSPNAEGRDTLFQIVERRMELSLFESLDILHRMIGYSGGCLRDLFRLIRQAALSALATEKSQIGGPELTSAYHKLKREYANTLADKVESDKVIIEVSEYYDALSALAQDPVKQPMNTDIILDLRQNLTILGYNGEGWCDVHPVVKDLLNERNLI